MAENDPKPSPLGRTATKDALLCEAFMLGMSWSQAAKYAGVSETTIRRRLKSPVFLSALEEKRRAREEMTFERLCFTSSAAALKLMEWINSDDPWVSLRAIQLAFGEKRGEKETAKLVEEIEKIKEMLAGDEPGPKIRRFG